MSDCPKFDPLLVQEQINNLSRQPFRDVLARFLKCAPTEGAIVEQAEKHPDRWAQSVAIVARHAGYNEKLEIEGSISHDINNLSDVELVAAIAAKRALLDMQSSDTTPQPIDLPSDSV